MKLTILSVRKAGKARGWKLHPCGQSPEYVWHFRPHVATCNSQRTERRRDMDYGRDFQTFKLRMGLPRTRRLLHLATSWRKTVQICGSLRSWTHQRTWISSKSFFISVKKKIRDYCKGDKKISSLEVTLLFVKNWVVKDRVGLWAEILKIWEQLDPVKIKYFFLLHSLLAKRTEMAWYVWNSTVCFRNFWRGRHFLPLRNKIMTSFSFWKLVIE